MWPNRYGVDLTRPGLYLPNRSTWLLQYGRPQPIFGSIYLYANIGRYGRMYMKLYKTESNRIKHVKKLDLSIGQY